jgi:hypothetical protein
MFVILGLNAQRFFHLVESIFGIFEGSGLETEQTIMVLEKVQVSIRHL